jgi:hypothetical protein
MRQAIAIGAAVAMAVGELVACGVSVPSPAATCGYVTPLPDQQQDAIVAAERKLPDDSPLIPALVDWHRMRDEARACAKAAR